MSLIGFVQKLQKKPRYIRFQILWLSVFICMFIILSLWVVSFKSSSLVSESLKGIRQDVPSLIGAFKSSISSFFEDGLGEDLEELEELYYNEIENETKLQTEATVKPAKLPISY